jgi:hypothetical protein
LRGRRPGGYWFIILDCFFYRMFWKYVNLIACCRQSSVFINHHCLQTVLLQYYTSMSYPFQVWDIFATGSGFGFLCNLNSDEASGHFFIFWSHPYIF